MQVYFDDRRCGAGKTFHYMRAMAFNPTRYLYVVDRVEEIDTRQNLIRGFAAEAGTKPHLSRIVSVSASEGGTSSVRREIEQLPELWTANSHVVVMISNQGMKMSDLSGFAGWEIIIDEDPSIFVAEQWTTTASSDYFDKHFKLEPFGYGINQIKLRATAPSVRDFHRDSNLAGLTAFRRYLDRQIVLTDDPETNPHRKTNTSKDAFSWFSVWSMDDLFAFDKVTILANAFPSKLTYKLSETLYDIDFVRVNEDDNRVWAERPITIRYFSQDREASISLFKKHEGQTHLRKIAKWIEENTEHNDHYYCQNHGVRIADLPGRKVSTKTTGRNDLMGFNVATALYAAKGKPVEDLAVRTLTGGTLGYNDIQRDRELEDLAQFILRSSLRDPKSTKAVEFRVYDHVQAEFLKRFIEENGYGTNVDLIFEDVGHVLPPVKKGGRPMVGDKAMTPAERMRRYREKKKQEKQ